jgi:phage gpG-like protein
MRIIRNDIDRVVAGLNGWLEDAAHIIGTEAVEEIHTHFEEEGVDGQAWKPRIPQTPRGDRRLLSDRGTLEDSIRYEVEGRRRRVIVGIDEALVPYARIHQEGGEVPVTAKSRAYFWAQYLKTGNDFYKRLALAPGPFKIPARPYMVITDRMLRRIEAALLRHLRRI